MRKEVQDIPSRPQPLLAQLGKRRREKEEQEEEEERKEKR